MGGVVARAMLVQPNYQQSSINTIITMSAPHARPPVTFDNQIVQIYNEINEYWRHAHSQRWANDNPLWHVTLVSIAGGNLDTIVPSDYASVESFMPETHGFTVFTTGIPTVWTSMDHQAILWCDQFRKVVAKTLYDIVDVNRASQTKPRAERISAFKQRLLTGLEASPEKPQAADEMATLLTLDDDSLEIVPAGQRLVLPASNGQSRPKAHLLALPPRGNPNFDRLTLLTDDSTVQSGESNQLDVLLCTVFTPPAGQPSTPFSASLDLSTGNAGVTRLSCQSVARDTVLLPASTVASRFPFTTERDRENPMFAYLQYDLDLVSDYQYLAVIDKSVSAAKARFAIAELSNASDYRLEQGISLPNLLTQGLSVALPANRPMVIEIQIPSIVSSLFAYRLQIQGSPCAKNQAVFEPLVRQYINHPFESRYFVNAKDVTVNLHGVAPYLPQPLHSRPDDGVTFQIWTDPICQAQLDLTLDVDILGSFGKLYMRYRTVFAAFPLLIVTLVLRKQFHVYDTTGVFVSFSESLDMSLRRSIPLLLLSLTLLSVSLSGALVMFANPAWGPKTSTGVPSIELHRNDLLVGLDDPFFWFLTPFIGIICTGVCTVVHFAILGLTCVFAFFYGLFATVAAAFRSESQRAGAPFIPSTSRRRMITTATLLFLVSIFIPYQFAYLVACLVQLFTVVRALRIQNSVTSGINSNYYHYAHSILLLMLWVLPINLPILAVWIRNLAVHWLTPFSSHHNVLSIMPFILLVENLTAGRMVPQLRSSLRHVTSVLLFGTALCAAIYGVSHAYILHYLVNIVAAWLVLVHLTNDSWSFTAIGAMFDENAAEGRKRGKAP
jgi:GPI inositol-deacylase